MFVNISALSTLCRSWRKRVGQKLSIRFRFQTFIRDCVATNATPPRVVIPKVQSRLKLHLMMRSFARSGIYLIMLCTSITGNFLLPADECKLHILPK